MEAVVPGLYASPPQPLPFAPSIDMRAYLCQREHGNLLIYTVRSLAPEAQAIEELGGVTSQYLNHRHEAEFVPESTASPLFVHDRDHRSVAEKTHVAGSFSARHSLDDFEVIPTPGHTPGTTTYLWDQGEHRVLFTGDTVYLSAPRRNYARASLGCEHFACLCPRSPRYVSTYRGSLRPWPARFSPANRDRISGGKH